MEVTNRLAALRKLRNVPAASLASTVGVTRQTIYAIEAGSYLPNTALGLKLARALGVKFDDLFSLQPDEDSDESRVIQAAVLPGHNLPAGQTVQLCPVNGKIVATETSGGDSYLPVCDGLVERGMGAGRARVRVHSDGEDFGRRILLAGCDPAMAIVADHVKSAGLEMQLVPQNSSQSLALLKAGLVHVAGSHLREEGAAETNVAIVRRLFPARTTGLVTFAVWQEGLVTAAGNRKSIRGVEDLVRKDIVFINRETGAGSRTLLDRHLRQAGIAARLVGGYSKSAYGHLAAARNVKAGKADCCVSTEACARFLGLHFIPLETVRYDLVIWKKHADTAGLQTFLDAIQALPFRKKLRRMAGYDTSQTGQWRN